MAKQSPRNQRGSRVSQAATSKRMEFPIPPADEKLEKLHMDIPGSLKWRMKLHMMFLESRGERTTYTSWVTELIEGALKEAEQERVG